MCVRACRTRERLRAWMSSAGGCGDAARGANLFLRWPSYGCSVVCLCPLLPLPVPRSLHAVRLDVFSSSLALDCFVGLLLPLPGLPSLLRRLRSSVVRSGSPFGPVASPS